jgi:polar amino acid transport system substrate-binding protein
MSYLAIFFRILSFAGLFVLVFAGCESDKEEFGWKAGAKLQIGTDATYPPFEMVNTRTGKPEGFDIDIMNAICRINGWDAEYIVTPFDGIISGLKSRKYDCVISAMTITPQRKAIISFSRPYYLAGQVVAVPVENVTINSVDDLTGRKVGVQLGTTGERLAKTLNGVEVFSFDNIGAAFIDMENGQIDAVLNDLPTSEEYIRLKGRAKIVGELLSKEYYGIAVRKNNHELLKIIDSALVIINETDEYNRISRKWFQTADSLK